MVSTNIASVTKQKPKRNAYSVAFRLKVIQYYESVESRSLCDTAKEFQLPPDTVKSFWRSRTKLKQQRPQDKRHRIRDPFFESLEKDLATFIKVAREHRLPVTGEVIKTKALLLRSKHNISEQMFQASNGWLQNFLNRTGIESARLHGEAGDVNEQAIQSAMLKVCDQLGKYDPQHIYNQDESGLVYQLLPNVSYLSPEENRKEVRGIKAMKAKNRITFTMCTNADGSHILDCMVIGKAKKPNAFALSETSDKLESLYRSQKNSWMDGKLFSYYLKDVWYPAVRKRTGNPVCMLMDNCSAHGDGLPDLDGVEYIFLPPNVTSVYQPMDQGIISCVKRYARSDMLRQMIEILPERESLRDIGKLQKAGTAGLKFGYGAHVLDAIRMLQRGLAQLSPKTVVNCWTHSGILSKRQIRMAHENAGLDCPMTFKRSPGLAAELGRTNNITSVIQMEIDACLDAVEPMPVGNTASTDSDAFLGVLMRAENNPGYNTDGLGGAELDNIMREWVEDLQIEEETPTQTVVRDPMAVVEAVNELELQIETVRAEDSEREGQQESRRLANVALVESQNSYLALQKNADWLRAMAEEGKRRGLCLDIQSSIVDALRKAHNLTRLAAPQSRQTSVADFFSSNV